MPRAKRLTAQQIMDTYEPTDKHESEFAENFWEDRLDESYEIKVSKDKSLHEDIAERGQRKPILLKKANEINKAQIIDGHHRLAVVHHLNPNQFVKYQHVDELR